MGKFMQKITTFVLFLFLILSVFIVENSAQTIENSQQKAPVKREFFNPFHSIKNFFKRIFSNQPQIICQLTFASVEDIELSQTEIVQKCLSTDKSCLEKPQTIQIMTKGKDFEDDILTYKYEITAGEIIGEGQKVVWDLSDVRPGTYSITAMVDDGCGFCGKSMTKTVTVKECQNCN